MRTKYHNGDILYYYYSPKSKSIEAAQAEPSAMMDSGTDFNQITTIADL